MRGEMTIRQSGAISMQKLTGYETTCANHTGGLRTEIKKRSISNACAQVTREVWPEKRSVWPDFMAVLTFDLLRGSSSLTSDGFVQGSQGP